MKRIKILVFIAAPEKRFMACPPRLSGIFASPQQAYKLLIAKNILHIFLNAISSSLQSIFFTTCNCLQPENNFMLFHGVRGHSKKLPPLYFVKFEYGKPGLNKIFYNDAQLNHEVRMEPRKK